MYTVDAEKLGTVLSDLKQATPKTRELALAVTKVQEALFWLQSSTISAPLVTLDDVADAKAAGHIP